MPFAEPVAPVLPRASATVVVMRDATAGLEVFMLERHLRSDFLGGAYVFPGGTVDDADTAPELEEVVDGLSGDVVRALGPNALALVVCAIRETFEEAGILLARHQDGAPVALDAPEWGERRRRLNSRETTALELAHEARIHYAADLLRFWWRLVTPAPAPRRYDTAFFVARAPGGQEPLHDDVETSSSTWVRPSEAVARGRAGDLRIIFPTRRTLESVGAYATTADAFDAAIGRSPEPVTPRIVLRDGEPRVELPDGTLERP
jgi:8-oxo-dGTP pyrophosphatase MutT (NUDIX family)